MNQTNNKRNFRILSIALVSAIFIAFAICLSSCDKIGIGASASDLEKAAVSTYFAEINSLSKDFNSALSDFQVDVKEKNVSGMQDKLNDAQSIIDNFNNIDVPETCGDVHKAYLDGYVQLQQSLSDYVQVYSDFVNGSIDNSVLQERVANLQKAYDQGIELLRQADKLASEK